jgi:hypothetical protein
MITGFLDPMNEDGHSADATTHRGECTDEARFLTPPDQLVTHVRD